MAYIRINLIGEKYKSHNFVDDTPDNYTNAKTNICVNCNKVIYGFKANDTGFIFHEHVGEINNDIIYKIYDMTLSCEEEIIKNIIE